MTGKEPRIWESGKTDCKGDVSSLFLFCSLKLRRLPQEVGFEVHQKPKRNNDLA